MRVLSISGFSGGGFVTGVLSRGGFVMWNPATWKFSHEEVLPR